MSVNCFSFWGTWSARSPAGASPLDPTGGLLSLRPPWVIPLMKLPGLATVSSKPRTHKQDVDVTDICRMQFAITLFYTVQ